MELDVQEEINTINPEDDDIIQILNIDDIDNKQIKISCLSEVIGNFGPWQKKFLIYYMLIYLISPFQNFGAIFYSAKADFWCADLAENVTLEEKKFLINKCVLNCKKYEYDKSLFYRTIYNEWDLICDRSWLVSSALSIYQVGYAVSSLLVGYCSDTFGRKPTFKFVILIEILSGYGQALAPNITLFILSRFILGIAAYGRFLTGILLIMETAGPKKRSILSIFVEISWYIGIYILIIFYYFVPDFRYVQFTVTTIEFIALFYLKLVPESIRWLLTKGKYSEARNMLVKAANFKIKKLNKKELDFRIELLIQHFKDQNLFLGEQNNKKKNLINLWQIPEMLTICLCLYAMWFTNNFIGYATTFNSTDFSNNLYLNIAVFTFASFVANLVLVFIIEKFNRLFFIKLSYFLTTISLLILTYNFFNESLYKHKKVLEKIEFNINSNQNQSNFHILNNILKEKNFTQLNFNLKKLNLNFNNLTLETSSKIIKKQTNTFIFWIAILMKCVNSFSYPVVYIITNEVFPTIMRQLSVGTCSFISRTASILSPFTKEFSQKFGLTLTFSIFTILSFSCFILSFFLPETKGKEIPNTLYECYEKQSKKQKIKSITIN